VNRKEVAAGFAWNASFSFINKALFPLIGIVIARILGPAEMGIYVLILAVVNVAEIFRDAGLGVTFIADPEGERREGVYTTLSIAFGLAMGVLLLLASAPIAGFYDIAGLSWGLAMASAAVGLNGLATIPANKLQKQARFRDAGFADTASSLLSYGVALPLVFSGYGFVGLVWQLLSRSGLFLLFNVWLARPALPAWSGKAVRGILAKSVAAMLNNIAYTFYTLGDKAVLGKMFGEHAVGLYGVAYNLAIKPLDFLTFPLGRTLLVAFSKSTEDRDRFRNIFARSLSAVLLLSLPLYAALAIYARPIVVGLYSEKFAGAVAPFALLSAYFFFRSCGNLAGNAIFALGRPVLNVVCWIPGYAIAGAGLWAGRGSLDLLGATAWIVLGAVTVYAINTGLAIWLLKPKAEDMARVGKAIAVGSATTGLLYACSMLSVPDLLALAIALTAGIAAHLTLVGRTFGTGWFDCFSPSGLRKLWNRL